MTSAATTLRSALEEVPSCCACGVFEIESGELLEFETTASGAQRGVEVAALAAANLIDERNVAAREFKRMVSDVVGDVTHGSYEGFNEVLLSLERAHHFVVRLQPAAAKTELAVIFTFDIDANLALSISQARLGLRDLGELAFV
jgi:hypothetical protein